MKGKIQKSKEERRNEQIDHEAQKLACQDDDSLLAMWEEAMLEWEQMQHANPKEAARIMESADQAFGKLMADGMVDGFKNSRKGEGEEEQDKTVGNRVRTECGATDGTCDVRRPDVREDQTGWMGHRGFRGRPVAGRKLCRKVVILAAAMAVLGIGGGMVTVARQGYQKTIYPDDDNNNQVIVMRNNAVITFQEGEIEAAYRQIKERLNIRVLAFDYLPKNMEFSQLTLTDEKGIIMLSQDDKRVYLKQKIMEDNDTISALYMDREAW